MGHLVAVEFAIFHNFCYQKKYQIYFYKKFYDEIRILDIHVNFFVNLPYILIKDITQNVIDGLRKEIINNNIPENIPNVVIKNIIQKLDHILDLAIKIIL